MRIGADTCTFACICISVVCITIICSFQALYDEWFTSCHGEAVITHDMFFVLVGIQTILNIVLWDFEKSASPRDSRLSNQQYSRSDHIHVSVEIPSIALADQGAAFRWGDDTKDADQISDVSTERDARDQGSHEPPGMDEEEMTHPNVLNFHNPPTKAPLCYRLNNSLCWNSIWMTLYFTIYFLGFHASLLSWRIYGKSESHASTVETCGHMKQRVFEDELPLTRALLSDFAFIEIFLGVATAVLCVRKRKDPYRLSSYFGCCETRTLSCSTPSVFQVVIQLSIAATAVTKITFCWIFGYGTPLQIVSGILLANVTLGVVSVLLHVLEMDLAHPLDNPALEYHWLWSMLCLAIIWGCGFLFYLSVYGLSWSPYFIPHVVCWLALGLVTICKFNSVFPLVNHGDVAEAYVLGAVEDVHDYEKTKRGEGRVIGRPQGDEYDEQPIG